jgi:hypothetical protein
LKGVGYVGGNRYGTSIGDKCKKKYSRKKGNDKPNPYIVFFCFHGHRIIDINNRLFKL